MDDLPHGPGEEIGRLGTGGRFHGQGVAVQGLALGVEDLADGPQGGAEAARGDRLVDLRHLHRGQGDGAQQHGRHLVEIALHAQLPKTAGDTIQPQFHAQVHRRQVVGLGQGQIEGHRAMGLAIVVLGLPALAIARVQTDALVPQGGGDVVFLGLVQGLDEDHRLDQGADGSDGLQCPVEAGIARLATTRQGKDLALGRRDHHRGAFQGAGFEFAQFFQVGQALPHRLLGYALDGEGEGGEDDQALGAQVLLPVVAFELTAHQVGEGRIGAHRPAALLADAQGGRLGVLSLVRLDDALVGHDIDDQIAAFDGPLRVTPRVVVGGALDQGDEQGALGDAQFTQVAIEIEAAGETKTMDGAAAILAQIDLIGIGLQDIVLGIA